MESSIFDRSIFDSTPKKNLMNKNFLSVPLCTLSQNVEYEKLTNLILHYGIVEFSRKDVWRDEDIVNHTDEDTIDEDFALWAYERVFRFKGSDGYWLIDNHSIVKKHVENFEKQYGKDAYFSIGTDLLFDAYKGNFKEREFRVYAAIRSVLGANKKYTRITMDRITYRMYGFKNKQAFENSGIIPVTKKMIKNSIDKLIDKGLIVSFTNRNRFTYYSTRLNLLELIDAVATEIKKKKSKRLSSKEVEERMRAMKTN